MSTAFGTITTLYSIANGSWSTAATWSTLRGGGAGTITPSSSTVVYICNGYTVNVAANNAASSNLTIEPGATLDVQTYTGHTFGTVVNNSTTGSGTLRIASATFPGGDWGGFLGANGGTVEYYQPSSGSSFTMPASVTTSLQFKNITLRWIDDLVAEYKFESI